MLNEISSAGQRLFHECNQSNPDLNKIDEYINECCCNNEDINTLFQSGTAKLSPLHMACHLGHYEIVQRLLDSDTNHLKPSIDVNINSDGYFQRTALHYACTRNFPLTVRALLQHPNIDVNKVDEYNSTPLVTACYGNRKSVIIELLKHPNIQLTMKGIYGCIPLHIACRDIMEDTDIIQMLIGHQQQEYRLLQISAVNDNHQTPLHIACTRNNYVAVVKLLEHTTDNDMNAITHVNHQTPLHIACSTYYLNNKTVSIIQNLLQKASIMIYKKKKKDNKTPFDIIQQRLDGNESRNNEQKQYLYKILQLFEDYYMEQRWQIYNYLIIYNENYYDTTTR